MKNFFLTSFILFSFYIHATDVLVNNSGQPGTYTTIQAAINSAVDGDRIVINPYNVYTENVTVNKSLTLISSTQGTYFVVNGTFNFEGSNNRNIILIGGEISNAQAVTGVATDYSNVVTIVDSKIYGYTANDFTKTNLLFNKIDGTVQVVNGRIIGNEPLFSLFNLYVAGATNPINDTLKVVANRMSGAYLNTNSVFIHFENNEVSNNNISSCSSNNGNCLTVEKLRYDLTIENKFINNTFYGRGIGTATYALIYFNMNFNASNTVFINNYFNNYVCSGTGVTLYSVAPINNQPKMYYNMANTSFAPSTFQQITSNIIGTNGTNLGHPNIEYYDIDLTRNDIGSYGGPYTRSNYTFPTDGKPRVFDLNMPFEIFSGTTPTIRAEGTEVK